VQIVKNDRHAKEFVEELSHTLAVPQMLQAKLNLVVIQGGDVDTSMRAMTIRMTDYVPTNPMKVT
jgi:transcriptional regulator